MKRDRIGAIDVGTTKVCTIMADVADGEIRVLGVGVVPSKGLHKGLVVNINEARESIRHSVGQAEQMAGRKLESVRLLLSRLGVCRLARSQCLWKNFQGHGLEFFL